MRNPYQPPKSSFQPPGTEDIRLFPRMSIWLVIGLTILTWGIYQLYWLYTRTHILNQLVPEKPVPTGLVNFVLSSIIVLFVLVLISVNYPPNQTIGAVIGIINLLSSIGVLIWVFIFRERLNHYTKAAPGQRHWLNLLPTFLFLIFFLHCIYLQHKINQMIDDQSDANSEMTIEA